MGASMSSMIPTSSIMSTVIGQTLTTAGDKNTWEKVKRAEDAVIENVPSAADLVGTAAHMLGSGALESLAKDLGVPDKLAHDADSFGHRILTNDKFEKNQEPVEVGPITSHVEDFGGTIATIARRAIESEELASSMPKMVFGGLEFGKHAFEQQAALHAEPTVEATATGGLGSGREVSLPLVASAVDAAIVGVFLGSILAISAFGIIRWTTKVSRMIKKQHQLRRTTLVRPAEKADAYDMV